MASLAPGKPARARMGWRGAAAIAWLALCVLGIADAQAQAPLRLARIENIPDQQVGAEILQAVYQRLGFTVEFVDLPAKRALLESSQGRVDGEVQRVLAVQSEYPSLLPVQPSINYIEPSAFVKRLDFPVDGWRSIAGYSIGIVRGVGSSERGTQGMARVEAVATMDQLMQMLAHDRIEVAVNDRFSGLLINRRLRLEMEIMRSPKFVEPRAMQDLRMVEPGPGEAMVIERVVEPPAPPTSVIAQR